MASVLIVEDDRDSCDVLDRFLRRSGHETECVPNGREALSVLVQQPPDVIVMDMCMPEMDGVSLLQVLRSYLRWNRLPVVLVTGAATAPQVQEAEELGVRGVFVKGEFKLKDLLACIERCVSAAPPPEAVGHGEGNPYLSN
jgi:CheY-like chemotaxis protein